MSLILKIFSGSLMRIIPLLLGGVSLLSGKLKSLKMSDFKKYAPYLLVIVAIIFLWRFLVQKKTLSSLSGESNEGKKAYLVASSVCDYLGTAKSFSWWHPARWFEDEKPVADLLKKNKSIIKEIEISYRELSGNNLMTDIEKFFDPKEKEYLSQVLGWGV